VVRCSHCGFDNPDGLKHCGECATLLTISCPKCGFANPPRFKFCGECGSALRQKNQGPTPGKEPRPPATDTIFGEQDTRETRMEESGERKTITALFADIKGSMALIEELDPEEARKVVDPALHIMMDAVHQFDGYVAQSLGDGIFALFGAPVAHEDHPQRAVYAALRMQENGRRYAEQLRMERGLNLQLRVGINTGEVVVRSIRKDDQHTDYVPVGHSTGLAARVESLALPGSILVTEHTHRLTEGYFQFNPMGPAQIKGVSTPLEIFEVTGVGPSRTRLQVAARKGLVRFVGRQKELQQLNASMELAHVGRGQMMGIVGEPGVGKSRLVHEFKQIAQNGSMLLESFSVSHGKALPYLPLIELLKNYFQISIRDDERQRREKINGRILTLDRSLEDTLPYFYALLGITDTSAQKLDVQTKRTRTFDAIKRVIFRESLNQPILLIMEDLHWLDSESQAFLSLLVESIASVRLFLLVNYRPEYQHNWGEKSYYTQIRLDPFGPAESKQLLDTLLGGNGEIQGVKKLILRKAEGNPFFIEEIVHGLVDQGIVVRTPKPSVTARLTDIRIPPTVQGVLSARIDRLKPEEKAFLQTLSVIGKEFFLSLLKLVVNEPEFELHRLLSVLQTAEFIHEQPAFPETKFMFKHALTQEVAYNSLLVERRNLLHEFIGNAIEKVFGDRLSEYYSDLAHHFSRSNNVAKAAQYLMRAGEQSLERSAYGEAAELFRRALGSLGRLPHSHERDRTEIRLQAMLGAALMASLGYSAGEVEHAHHRARELAEAIGDKALLIDPLLGLCIYHLLKGELEASAQLSGELMDLGVELKESRALVSAHLTTGIVDLHSGELENAVRHFDEVIALYDRARHARYLAVAGQDPVVISLCFSASALFMLGYSDQAMAKDRAALQLAYDLNHPFSLVCALGNVAQKHIMRGEAGRAREYVEELKDLSREHRFPFWQAQAMGIEGLLMSLEGNKREALAMMKEAFVRLRSTGAELGKASTMALMAEEYSQLGNTDEAIALLERAESEAQLTGSQMYISQIHRVRGVALLAISPDNREEAARCFREAIESARRFRLKLFELEATVSLCMLLRDQGDITEACSQLEHIFGWFTEGLDTLPLKKARALFEELQKKQEESATHDHHT